MKFKFLIIIIFFSGLNLFAKNKNLQEVLIGVPKTISSIPLYELNEKKIDNYLIKIEFFDDHIVTMGRFIKGDINILATGFNQGVSYYSEKKDITQICCFIWGVSSLVTNNSTIKSIVDLKGKKVGVPFIKSPLDLQIKAILSKENLLNEVSIEYAPIQQQIPMLLTGKLDAISIPEPLVSKLVIKNNCIEIFSFPNMWKNLNNGDPRSPQVSIFVKNTYLKDNKKFIDNLFKSFNNIITKLDFNSKELLEKYSLIFDVDTEILKRSFKNIIMEIPGYKTSIALCNNYFKIINENIVLDENFFYKY